MVPRPSFICNLHFFDGGIILYTYDNHPVTRCYSHRRSNHYYKSITHFMSCHSCVAIILGELLVIRDTAVLSISEYAAYPPPPMPPPALHSPPSPQVSPHRCMSQGYPVRPHVKLQAHMQPRQQLVPSFSRRNHYTPCMTYAHPIPMNQ